jgi:hypothetical protein
MVDHHGNNNQWRSVHRRRERIAGNRILIEISLRPRSYQYGTKGFEINGLRKPGFRLVEISLPRQAARTDESLLWGPDQE